MWDTNVRISTLYNCLQTGVGCLRRRASPPALESRAPEGRDPFGLRRVLGFLALGVHVSGCTFVVDSQGGPVPPRLKHGTEPSAVGAPAKVVSVPPFMETGPCPAVGFCLHPVSLPGPVPGI